MKFLNFITAVVIASSAASGDTKPVKSIDIQVVPYYSAYNTKADYVNVYDAIDDLLLSGDLNDFKQALKIVAQRANVIAPTTLFVISARAYDLGLRDDAVFWFYVAKNRAITLKEVINLEDDMFFETKHAINAFIKLVGEVINPYAFCDIDKQREIMLRSIEWVKQYPYQALLVPDFPSKHINRKVARKNAENLLEQNLKEQDRYFADPKNLAEFKAARKKNGVEERFCYK